MDIALFNEIGKEFKRRLRMSRSSRILTHRGVGIGIAAVAAQYFQVRVGLPKRRSRSIWTAICCPRRSSPSPTKRRYEVIVASRFLNPGENVLIIDDFLANGCRASACARSSRRRTAMWPASAS